MSAPELVIIAALAADNRVIGVTGRLPWHFPEDLARFKQLTWGHALIMGRVTWEQGLQQRTLPHRHTIVLSRSLPLFPPEHGDHPISQKPISQQSSSRQSITRRTITRRTITRRTVVRSLSEGFASAAAHGAKRIFIIGGADIYRQTLALAHRWELTLIQGSYQGDAYFPAYGALLSEVDCVASQTDGPLTYVTYVRRSITVFPPVS